MLGPESELDATVEDASDLGRSGGHGDEGIEVDRAWNRKHVRILDDRYLPEADAGLSDRTGRNEADVDLPRVEHLEHLARCGLLDVDFKPAGAAAAHERIGQ